MAAAQLLSVALVSVAALEHAAARPQHWLGHLADLQLLFGACSQLILVDNMLLAGLSQSLGVGWRLAYPLGMLPAPTPTSFTHCEAATDDCELLIPSESGGGHEHFLDIDCSKHVCLCLCFMLGAFAAAA